MHAKSHSIKTRHFYEFSDKSFFVVDTISRLRRVGVECLREELVVVDLAVEFLVELRHDLVDFFFIEHHVAEPQNVAELGQREVAGALRVQLLECPPQVSPVAHQLIT